MAERTNFRASASCTDVGRPEGFARPDRPITADGKRVIGGPTMRLVIDDMKPNNLGKLATNA
jgi:hypothetical protein